MLLGLLHLLPLASCHGLAAAHRLRGGAALTLPPLVGAYQSALAAAPITTNVLSAAGLSVLADGMAQAVERRGSWDVASWDVSRAVFSGRRVRLQYSERPRVSA